MAARQTAANRLISPSPIRSSHAASQATDNNNYNNSNEKPEQQEKKRRTVLSPAAYGYRYPSAKGAGVTRAAVNSMLLESSSVSKKYEKDFAMRQRIREKEKEKLKKSQEAVHPSRQLEEGEEEQQRQREELWNPSTKAPPNYIMSPRQERKDLFDRLTNREKVREAEEESENQVGEGEKLRERKGETEERNQENGVVVVAAEDQNNTNDHHDDYEHDDDDHASSSRRSHQQASPSLSYSSSPRSRLSPSSKRAPSPTTGGNSKFRDKTQTKMYLRRSNLNTYNNKDSVLLIADRDIVGGFSPRDRRKQQQQQQQKSLSPRSLSPPTSRASPREEGVAAVVTASPSSTSLAQNTISTAAPVPALVEQQQEGSLLRLTELSGTERRRIRSDDESIIKREIHVSARDTSNPTNTHHTTVDIVVGRAAPPTLYQVIPSNSRYVPPPHLYLEQSRKVEEIRQKVKESEGTVLVRAGKGQGESREPTLSMSATVLSHQPKRRLESRDVREQKKGGGGEEEGEYKGQIDPSVENSGTLQQDHPQRLQQRNEKSNRSRNDASSADVARRGDDRRLPPLVRHANSQPRENTAAQQLVEGKGAKTLLNSPTTNNKSANNGGLGGVKQSHNRYHNRRLFSDNPFLSYSLYGQRDDDDNNDNSTLGVEDSTMGSISSPHASSSPHVEKGGEEQGALRATPEHLYYYYNSRTITMARMGGSASSALLKRMRMKKQTTTAISSGGVQGTNAERATVSPNSAASIEGKKYSSHYHRPHLVLTAITSVVPILLPSAPADEIVVDATSSPASTRNTLISGETVGEEKEKEDIYRVLAAVVLTRNGDEKTGEREEGGNAPRRTHGKSESKDCGENDNNEHTIDLTITRRTSVLSSPSHECVEKKVIVETKSVQSEELSLPTSITTEALKINGTNTSGGGKRQAQENTSTKNCSESEGNQKLEGCFIAFFAYVSSLHVLVAPPPLLPPLRCRSLDKDQDEKKTKKEKDVAQALFLLDTDNNGCSRSRHTSTTAADDTVTRGGASSSSYRDGDGDVVTVHFKNVNDDVAIGAIDMFFGITKAEAETKTKMAEKGQRNATGGSQPYLVPVRALLLTNKREESFVTCRPPRLLAPRVTFDFSGNPLVTALTAIALLERMREWKLRQQDCREEENVEEEPSLMPRVISSSGDLLVETKEKITYVPLVSCIKSVNFKGTSAFDSPPFMSLLDEIKSEGLHVTASAEKSIETRSSSSSSAVTASAKTNHMCASAVSPRRRFVDYSKSLHRRAAAHEFVAPPTTSCCSAASNGADAPNPHDDTHGGGDRDATLLRVQNEREEAARVIVDDVIAEVLTNA